MLILDPAYFFFYRDAEGAVHYYSPGYIGGVYWSCAWSTHIKHAKLYDSLASLRYDFPHVSKHIVPGCELVAASIDVEAVMS